MIEPAKVPRDKNGWPQAFWDLAGADPDFDLGDRDRAHERGDVFETGSKRQTRDHPLGCGNADRTT